MVTGPDGDCRSLAGFFIRVDNLCNSQIIGTPAKVPWAFIFKWVDALTRNNAKLNKAIAYLLIFLVLSWLYKKNRGIKKEYIFYILFIKVFGVRFIIELWKIKCGITKFMGRFDR